MTANFALVQPSLQADLPKILEAVVKVAGGKAPKLEDLPGVKEMPAGDGPKGPTPKLTGLLRPVIQKTATAEDVEKAAEAIEEYVKENEAAQGSRPDRQHDHRRRQAGGLRHARRPRSTSRSGRRSTASEAEGRDGEGQKKDRAGRSHDLVRPSGRRPAGAAPAAAGRLRHRDRPGADEGRLQRRCRATGRRRGAAGSGCRCSAATRPPTTTPSSTSSKAGASTWPGRTRACCSPSRPAAWPTRAASASTTAGRARSGSRTGSPPALAAAGRAG